MVEQVPALIRTFSLNAERHATSHVDVACTPTRPLEPTVWYAQFDKPHTAELYGVNKIPCLWYEATATIRGCRTPWQPPAPPRKNKQKGGPQKLKATYLVEQLYLR
jgi:hypothetical protein